MLFVRTVSVTLRELYPPIILRELCPPSCHSEGAQRPKNLFLSHPGELLFLSCHPEKTLPSLCHPEERSDEGSSPRALRKDPSLRSG